MIAIDTNVALRLIVRDDPEQFERATRLVATRPCFVADTVLLETAWMLRSVFGTDRIRIHAALAGIVGLENVFVADTERVRLALQWFSEGLDFADALHLAGSQHTSGFISFDRRMMRRARGKGICPVTEPPQGDPE